MACRGVKDFSYLQVCGNVCQYIANRCSKLNLDRQYHFHKLDPLLYRLQHRTKKHKDVFLCHMFSNGFILGPIFNHFCYGSKTSLTSRFVTIARTLQTCAACPNNIGSTNLSLFKTCCCKKIHTTNKQFTILGSDNSVLFSVLG